MAWFETWFKNDLAKPINVVQLQGVMFNLDNLANKIGVELEYNGQPAALEGTIAGYVIRNDGTTLNLTTNTGKDGNKAWVILPQEAYTVEGPISIVIKLVYNSAETTIGACAGYVTRSRTSSEIAPTGTVIPSLASLEAAIAAANAAAVNAADAVDYIAPTEEDRTASAPHAVGSDFIYDGKLMKATSAIAQGATIVPYASGVQNYNCAEVPNGLSGDVYNVTNTAKAAANNAADAQQLVAPLESMAGIPTSVATMPHTTGSYFVFGGVLYEATADIAIGGNIVTTGTGANCRAVPGGAMGEVADLKSAIDKYDNPFESTNEYYTSGIKQVCILSASAANYRYYMIRAIQKNTTYHLYLALRGSDDGDNWTAIGNIEVAYDAQATYPRVETIYATNNAYFVVIDWDYVTANNLINSSLNAILKNDIVNKTLIGALGNISTMQGDISDIQGVISALPDLSGLPALESAVTTLQTNEQMYNSAFAVAVPNEIRGIINVEIYNTSYQIYSYYRFSKVRHNSSHYFYAKLEGSNDGETWTGIEEFAVPASSAPDPQPALEVINGAYNRATVTILWGLMGNSFNLADKDYRLKNTLINKQLDTIRSSINTLTANEQKYDTPFSVVVPAYALGIVDVRIAKGTYLNYSEYRIDQLRHNSLYWFYARLQGWNGEAWSTVDTFNIAGSAAPDPAPKTEMITSVNGRAIITVVWPLMGSSITQTGIDLRIKNTKIIDWPYYKAIAEISRVDQEAQLNAYELSDKTKHVVTVDASGSGDYTTIAAAYAAITDSAFDNQYEVVVYPGTYNENNLLPPPYTHTHGIFPGLTIVDSTGLYDAEHPDYSVFDQGHAPSKLSNMVIKSQTKYCVHQDVELRGIVLVNENLTCIRLAGGNPNNSACIGIGADFDGAKFVWRNCTFINGEVASHTNPNDLPNGNQHIIYENCTFVNAYINLLVSGNTMGEYVCEVKGCRVNPGNPGLRMKAGADVGSIANFPWQVIGGNNNFAPVFVANDGTYTDAWDNVSTNEKVCLSATATIGKGDFVTVSGDKADNTTDKTAIVGIAVKNASTGDYLPVWTGPINYTATDGEYGLDANGDLDSSATVKIGRVVGNIFYPYY